MYRRGLVDRFRWALCAPLCLFVALGICGCGADEEEVSIAVPGVPGALKGSALTRARRRAFDGAPPVIPHADFGAKCTVCHSAIGGEVPGIGYAPALPHGDGLGKGQWSRCRQCHVPRGEQELFVETSFVPLGQNLRKGSRAYPGAPPVIPHQVLLRERCVACHTGPGAREEIRCSHPDRQNCRQCHAEVHRRGEFLSAE